MLVHFRERISTNLIKQINLDMVKTQGEKKKDEEKKNRKFRSNQGGEKSR